LAGFACQTSQSGASQQYHVSRRQTMIEQNDREMFKVEGGLLIDQIKRLVHGE
jgi:hypothetical protein